MPVTCPHCNTRYVLPEALLGPGGARVRCPRCREPFGVGPDGASIVPLPAATAAPRPNGNGAHETPAAEAAAEPATAAREAEGGREAWPPATEPAVAVTAEPEGPAAIARAVLDDLGAHSGEAIAASLAAGRLFSEFGDVIAEAYEFYRRRVGPNADPAPFRAALRERWAVDLDPGHPPKRLG